MTTCDEDILSRDRSDIELSVVIPCLNEARTLRACIEQARGSLIANAIEGEIIVADNGSNDDSASIALSAGAAVINVPERGYGSALLGGIAVARGEFVIMADGDGSYDFSHIPRFLAQLRSGCDLVIGNRFAGGIQPGAMPALHRYFGNPFLTFMGRLIFGSPVGDFHCGIRGFRRVAAGQLELRTTGMELATEMIVKATLHGLQIGEVPTTLSPDGRNRPPHLRSFRDGWRHLWFMMSMAPRGLSRRFKSWSNIRRKKLATESPAGKTC